MEQKFTIFPQQNFHISIQMAQFSSQNINATVSFLSRLLDFPSMRYDLELWPLTLNSLIYRWSSLHSCMIIKLTVWSLFCLHCFNTKWCYELDLWSWQTTGAFFHHGHQTLQVIWFWCLQFSLYLAYKI
jgi:hypothetical protein